MRVLAWFGLPAGVAMALVGAMFPAAAWASREHPKTPEELAADHAYIRSLNLRELAYVRQRDAARARQQEASREARENYRDAYDDYVQRRVDYLRRRNAYEGAMDHYAAQRVSYENRMAEWRRNVAACRAGNASACDR